MNGRRLNKSYTSQYQNQNLEKRQLPVASSHPTSSGSRNSRTSTRSSIHVRHPAVNMSAREDVQESQSSFYSPDPSMCTLPIIQPSLKLSEKTWHPLNICHNHKKAFQIQLADLVALIIRNRQVQLLLISKISYPCTRMDLYKLVDSRSFLGY